MGIKSLVSNSTSAPWGLVGRCLLLATLEDGSKLCSGWLPHTCCRSCKLPALCFVSLCQTLLSPVLSLPEQGLCSASKSNFHLVPGVSTNPATLRVNEHAHNGKQKCKKKKSFLNTVCRLWNSCKYAYVLYSSWDTRMKWQTKWRNRTEVVLSVWNYLEKPNNTK